MDISTLNKRIFKNYSNNKTLIKKLKKGNIECLMDWMEFKKDKYYKIGWSYLYNHYDVEDVFQGTIIKIYEKINTLREEKYFETWVTSIFINECKGILRKRKREVTLDNVIDSEESYEDDSNIEFKELLDSLEDIYREVILLKVIGGYSQEDISKILDIPIGTVKSRIYRGLKTLRELKNREVL